MLRRMYIRCVPRLVEGRGLCSSLDAVLIELSTGVQEGAVQEGAAFFHNVKNFESRLQRVRGGRVGI